MRSCAVNKLVLGIVALLFITCVSTTTIRAVSSDTDIGATVCNGQAATLTIQAPGNDTTLAESAIKVQGTVERVNSIEIYIDGSINSTASLAVNQVTFSQDVLLGGGTHTIRVSGNDSCHVGNPEASVVVTYRPKISPGQPGSTDIPAEGIYIGGKPSAKTSQAAVKTSALSKFFTTFIITPALAVAKATDIYSSPATSDGSYPSTSQQVTNSLGRFLLVAAGFIILAASASAVIVATLAQLLKRLRAPKAYRGRRFARLDLIVTGIGFIMLAFVL